MGDILPRKDQACRAAILRLSHTRLRRAFTSGPVAALPLPRRGAYARRLGAPVDADRNVTVNRGAAHDPVLVAIVVTA
ncbi:hypothetical protein MAXJ12_23732 [Mesorhizobium alhagi CCNWXJ12-2]|uniref:Uncharacterized protein n=1 Tax=Mesorhizobium alhagi CCNWXJ12-2 TaxID=1107882 RepID=H0HX29_9HYPH|nr:hypothetical protein MAXJ12_23732 [Mesorhizobium alhagi CCNWXJ12-2]